MVDEPQAQENGIQVSILGAVDEGPEQGVDDGGTAQGEA